MLPAMPPNTSATIQTFAALAERITQQSQRNPSKPVIIAIDGRAGAGKTSFAARLATALAAPVVHTDDIAWHHSFFDWWPLLIEQIIKPFLAGQSVEWTPADWTRQGRTGAISVPVAPILIVEGVASSRRELGQWLACSIWIETDLAVAEARGLERDGPAERDFWFEWQAVERPLLAADRPWERAALIVNGAPTLDYHPESEFVAIIDLLD
jgi:hypothetical protein